METVIGITSLAREPMIVALLTRPPQHGQVRNRSLIQT